MYLKSKYRIIFLLIIFLTVLTACPKPKQYPPEPQIQFEQVQLKDSVDLLGNTNKVYRLKFGLIDGDGDIGLEESDSAGIFHPDSLYSNDLFTTLYEIINGDTIKVDSSKQRNFRIPYVEPQGQNKTLIADLYININFSYNGDGNLPYDSIYFDFYIVDRKLHKSNIQSTPVLKLDTVGFFPSLQ
ncbi:MAG: hypothetical protein L3J56_02925 [Bacteroidales bacterium]|nr:hypothetical protein [Bacteroidales bacterium]